MSTGDAEIRTILWTSTERALASGTWEPVRHPQLERAQWQVKVSGDRSAAQVRHGSWAPGFEHVSLQQPWQDTTHGLTLARTDDGLEITLETPARLPLPPAIRPPPLPKHVHLEDPVRDFVASRAQDPDLDALACAGLLLRFGTPGSPRELPEHGDPQRAVQAWWDALLPDQIAGIPGILDAATECLSEDVDELQADPQRDDAWRGRLEWVVSRRDDLASVETLLFMRASKLERRCAGIVSILDAQLMPWLRSLPNDELGWRDPYLRWLAIQGESWWVCPDLIDD